MQIDFNLHVVSVRKRLPLHETVEKPIDWGISLKFLLLGGLVALLSACTLFTSVPEISYSRSVDQGLYHFEPWSLEGRLALTGEHDSWTAGIVWDHHVDEEQIKLSGPFGQGAVSIHLDGNVVTIAHGDGSVESSDDPEAFINQQLGMFVPVTSLRYWVLGLPAEPGRDFADTEKGFQQSGWAVDYQSMQRVGQSNLPRKISVSNDHVKLKLIIDQWMLNDKNEH